MQNLNYKKGASLLKPLLQQKYTSQE